MRLVRLTLIAVGVIQMLFGAALLIEPAVLLGGFEPQPAASNWIFATAAARCIGYGIGMFAAAHAPARHRLWIDTMIGIQVVDFAATAGCLAVGMLPTGITGAAVLPPLLWVFLLSWARWQLRTAPIHGKGISS
jgi:hypothetical protein